MKLSDVKPGTTDICAHCGQKIKFEVIWVHKKFDRRAVCPEHWDKYIKSNLLFPEWCEKHPGTFAAPKPGSIKRTCSEYEIALDRTKTLLDLDPPAGTKEYNELELLLFLIENWVFRARKQNE